MNNALRMFKELGFSLIHSDEEYLLYQYKADYDEVTVYFDLQKKTYHSTWSRFVNNNEGALVPMAQRPQNIKDSCRYGHWQREGYHEIDVEQHKAIHQQMIELGWINE